MSDFKMDGDGRPDFVNRDPNSINGGLQVAFEDIFGEPESAHSIDCAWKCAFMCYEGSKNCCYKCLTVLCSWFCGLCWGCEFACLTFCHIYQLTPTIKEMGIVCGVCRKMYEEYLNCMLGPICAACGMCLSNIKIVRVGE